MTAGIDAARLPFLVDLVRPARHGGDDSQDQGDDGPGQSAKRRRRTSVECACHPQPRRLQLTPKRIEDGPIICGLCCAPFGLPEDDWGRDESAETDLYTGRPAGLPGRARPDRHRHRTTLRRTTPLS